MLHLIVGNTRSRKTTYSAKLKDARLKRILRRNNEKGYTFEFELSQADFDLMESWFETPTDKEMIEGLISLGQ